MIQVRYHLEMMDHTGFILVWFGVLRTERFGMVWCILILIIYKAVIQILPFLLSKLRQVRFVKVLYGLGSRLVGPTKARSILQLLFTYPRFKS